MLSLAKFSIIWYDTFNVQRAYCLVYTMISHSKHKTAVHRCILLDNQSNGVSVGGEYGSNLPKEKEL